MTMTENLTEPINFDDAFLALTGNKPFPWQRELYRLFVEDGIPASCNIPTGLGKTAVIAIWLLALAARPHKVPRRLVYVVNRRTVVDQATREVEKIRDYLLASNRSEAAARIPSVRARLGSSHAR